MLEVLILNGNTVGDDGARFLMNALKLNSSLQYLGLQVGGRWGGWGGRGMTPAHSACMRACVHACAAA